MSLQRMSPKDFRGPLTSPGDIMRFKAMTCTCHEVGLDIQGYNLITYRPFGICCTVGQSVNLFNIISYISTSTQWIAILSLMVPSKYILTGDPLTSPPTQHKTCQTKTKTQTMTCYQYHCEHAQ